MIYVTGDKHGEVEMYRLYKRHRPISLNENDKLIIAGDFGLVWDRVPRSLTKGFIDFLTNQKWQTLFVDGNHENHDLLAELPREERWGGVVGVVIPEKIFHLRRGEIYTIDGVKILSFGGAQSHDKLERKLGLDWWEAEIPSYAEMDNCLTNIEKHNNAVDYVITHTCPQEISDHILSSYGMYNKSRNGDPTCKMLSHIASILDFKDWYFGHWHLNFDFGKYHCLWHTYKSIGNKEVM